MKGSYLGPEIKQNELEKELKEIGANFKILNESELMDFTTESLKMVMQLVGFKEEWNLDLVL